MSALVVRRFLKRLTECGERGIPESDIPKNCKEVLAKLENCACVQRVQGIRGAVYTVRDQGILAQYVLHIAPLGLEIGANRPTSRAEAVLRFGDSKVAAAGDCLGVFIRSTKESMVVTSELGAINVSELTRIAGGAAVLLREGLEWKFSGTSVAIVENSEAFWHHDLVLPHVDLAIWTIGRMSARRLLAWLASPAMQHCQYTHWGDYDPVGVAEYLRLRRACPGRVCMWVPADLEALLMRYGKASLLLKRGNSRVYSKLHRVTDDPIVARLVQLFDTHHFGLEQEILLRRPSG